MKDLTGQRYGQLRVIAFSHLRRRAFWKCACDCGGFITVRSDSLQSGNTSSCGCKANKHGHACTATIGISAEYRAHSSMLYRCYNKDAPNYHNYGGRGIKVCRRWCEPDGVGFKNFLVDMGPRPPNFTLERKNVNKGYTPSNCEWASRKTQSMNKRNTLHDFTYRGATRPLKEWAEVLQMSYYVLYARIVKYGWTVTRAFNTPIQCA
jgi:hypothetical protein